MNLSKSGSGHYFYSKGEGNPLLLLHGFPDCAENFQHQLEFFSSHGYQVIAPYLPGYHPEDKELDTYQSLRIAEEVIEFIRKNKGNPVLAMVLINKKADDEIEGVPLRALIRARPVRN